MGYFYTLFYTGRGHNAPSWYLMNDKIYEDETWPTGTLTLFVDSDVIKIVDVIIF